MAAAKKEKKPIMSCASSGQITKLKQSIFAPFDIYDTAQGLCTINILLTNTRNDKNVFFWLINQTPIL
jgi:hypothetical protein